ncbi:MAG: hypothetical protein JWQ40_2513 [Segetibacter sp.]|nr:hypothetical protein [Segetibacter sp.]
MESIKFVFPCCFFNNAVQTDPLVMSPTFITCVYSVHQQNIVQFTFEANMLMYVATAIQINMIEISFKDTYVLLQDQQMNGSAAAGP